MSLSLITVQSHTEEPNSVSIRSLIKDLETTTYFNLLAWSTATHSKIKKEHREAILPGFTSQDQLPEVWMPMVSFPIWKFRQNQYIPRERHLWHDGMRRLLSPFPQSTRQVGFTIKLHRETCSWTLWTLGRQSMQGQACLRARRTIRKRGRILQKPASQQEQRRPWEVGWHPQMLKGILLDKMSAARAMLPSIRKRISTK